MILYFLILVSIIAILTYIFVKKFIYTKSYDLEIINGWISLDWNTLSRNKVIRKYLIHTQEAIESQDPTWKEAFVSNHFSKIHYSDKNSLLSTCKYIFDNETIDQNNIITSRRNLTASSIIFNFKIPHNLWLIDSVTIEIVFRYKYLTQFEMYSKEYIANLPFQFNRKNANEFRRMTAHCNQVYLHALKLKYGDFYPNIVYLYHHIKKIDCRLFKSILEDINTLKKLLTVYFIIAEISIPKDYVLIDDCVVGYLNKLHKYSGPKLIDK